MGKKRKTYKEKLIADLRRKVYTLEGIKSASFEANKKDKPVYRTSSTSATIVNQNHYPFLLKDITKTGILTTSIIAIQIILFLILKNKIISIPIVSY